MKEGKDWDQLLVYVLFEYREVPQATTGFSPFELLCSRAVWGPLDILKETWEAEESEESVVSYILSVQEKLAGMMELVKQNSTKAKAQQKAWYDRNARERESYSQGSRCWCYYLCLRVSCWRSGRGHMKF